MTHSALFFSEETDSFSHLGSELSFPEFPKSVSHNEMYACLSPSSRCRSPQCSHLPQAAMSRARQPPLVTGISPKEGAAWTKVTIRGENLGTGPGDLIGITFITT